MRIREIPRYRWSTFLDGFSREHRGCSCTLDVDSIVAGPGVEARSWPFQGLALETGHGVPCVQVFVGDQRERHLGHALAGPRHIWIEETPDGERAGLRIEAEEGALHLRFSTPQAPEYIETYLP
jgi:hypothetical protein